jgi:hypothetical protein
MAGLAIAHPSPSGVPCSGAAGVDDSKAKPLPHLDLRPDICFH